MGFQDRDYVRQDRRSIFDGMVPHTQVCLILIGINIFAYLIQLSTRGPFGIPGWFTEAFILDSEKVFQGQIWRLLTSAFLHDYSSNGVGHIVFNMLFLWWFGSLVEEIYGSREFLWFYLAAAIFASIGYIIAQQIQGQTGRALGASGALTAVMIVYASKFPNRIILFMFFLPIPIWCFVLFQILNDIFGLMGVIPDRIAFAAHLSGALFGFLYVRFDWRVSNWIPNFSRRAPDYSGPRKSKIRLFEKQGAVEENDNPESISTLPLPSAVPSSGAATATADRKIDEYLEAKLDEVLEKVTKFGKDSLSPTEQEILLKASEIYRKKRQG